MVNHRVFTGGIVWDPREPLPAELQPGLGYGSYGPYGRESAAPGLGTAAPYFDGNIQMKAAYLPVDDVGQPGHPGHLPGGGQAVGLGTPQALQAAARKNLPRYTVQEHGRNVLPPLSVKVDASIVQDTAQVAVTQLFWNDSSIPIKEAAFTFPLPAGCTVTDFSCQIGPNKIIRGTVKPREEARQEFKRHIRTHDTAAGLLEQDTPEIFTTTLGNVPEKTKVKVNLTYITVLKHHFADSRNLTTLIIPTAIARRYGDAPEEYNGADTTNVPQGLTLEIEVVESERITSITSPSHAIEVERRRGTRNAESFADLAGGDGRSNVETAAVALPSGSMLLDKDFVLDIETAPDGNSENPQAWLEEHPTLPNHKALMLTLPPEFLTNTAKPVQRSEILFLADRSGSMSDKIVSLRSAMRFFLKGIPEGRKFNIWCFGDDHISWQPYSVDYTESTLNSALSWVEQSFYANMGGTELLPALEAIVDARDKTLVTDVIVLTDGEVWRLDQTLDYIQKTRGLTEGRVRFFALGIGHAVSHALVDGIAKAGGGYAEVVQEASQGGWEDRVVSMAKAALLSAHLGPLHLEFNIQDKDGNTRNSTLADAKRSPADISAIGPFDRNRIYFLSDSIAESESITSVKVEIEANQEIKTLVIPVTVLKKRDTMLHKLAARSMLEDLELGRSHIHLGPNRLYQGTWQERNRVRKEAEEIACKWSLVSKWTSFFLAEEPYIPAEKDPFMDGVVEVKDAPGDDLLQPRLNTQRIGVLESVESIATPSQSELSWDWSASSNQQTSRANAPSISYRSRPSHSQVYRQGHSSAFSSSDMRYSVPRGSVVAKAREVHADSSYQHSGNVSGQHFGYNNTSGITFEGDTSDDDDDCGPALAYPALRRRTRPPARSAHSSGFYDADFSIAHEVVQIDPRRIGGVSTNSVPASEIDTMAGATSFGISSPTLSKLDEEENARRSQRRGGGDQETREFAQPAHSTDWYGELHKQPQETQNPPVLRSIMGISSTSGSSTLAQLWDEEDVRRSQRERREDGNQVQRPSEVDEGANSYDYGDLGGMPPDTWALRRARSCAGPGTCEYSDQEDARDVRKRCAEPAYPSKQRPWLKAQIPDDPQAAEADGYTSREPSPASTAFRLPPPDATVALLPELGDQDLPDNNPFRLPPLGLASSVPVRHLACYGWRAQHVECDGNKPCSRCATSNTECDYATSRRGKGPTIRRTADTNDRGERAASPSPKMFDKASVEEVDIRTEKEFISLILGYQQFNGCIDFGSWTIAAQYLGKDITNALGTHLSDSAWVETPIRLWTAAVYVLLERDFQPYKSLWELMAMKMASYCQISVSWGAQWLGGVKKTLGGLKLPLHQQKGQEDAGSSNVNTVAMETVAVAPEPQAKVVEMEDSNAHSQPQPEPEVDDHSDLLD